MSNAHALPAWQLVFTGLFGLLFLLLGYRSMRVTARLFSGLLFCAIGVAAAQKFQAPGWAVLLSGAGGGVLGFLLGNVYYLVHMAVNGAFAGFVLAALGSGLATGQANLPLSLLAAVVGGIAAVVFERRIGILATSVLGGAFLMLTAQGLAALANLHAPNRFGGAYAALFVGLTVLGCVVQAKTTKNLPVQGSAPAGRA